LKELWIRDKGNSIEMMQNRELNFFEAITYIVVTFIICLFIVFLQDLDRFGLGVILLLSVVIIIHVITLIVYLLLYYYFKKKKLIILLGLLSINILISFYLRFFQLEIFT
tara:strand:- start:184330 stop:184659 length:330 start_codon:yes stop_codon:yes gene_type:complete